MDRRGSIRIQAEAARALAEWKAFFAEQIAVKAEELATKSNLTGPVTLAHYRQAARTAVKALSTAIQNTDSSNGSQEAA